MNRVKLLLRLANAFRRARALDYEKDPNPEHWKTINGAKVHLDKNGNYDGGASGKFNGKHHYGPDYKAMNANMNNLANVFRQVVAQKQAQANAQGNGQGNTSSQNVASKATQGGGGSGIITPKVSVKNFPSVYGTGVRKASTKKACDRLNEISQTDPNVCAIYGSLGTLLQRQQGKQVIRHNQDENYGKCKIYKSKSPLECEIIAPNISDKVAIGKNRQRSQMCTWFHEHMHEVDFLIGEKITSGRYVSAVFFSEKNQKLKDAIRFANPEPSAEIKNWLISQEIKRVTGLRALDDKRAAAKKALRDECSKGKIGLSEYIQGLQKCDDDSEKELVRFEEELYEGDGAGHRTLSDLYDALSGGSFFTTGLGGIRIPGHGVNYYYDVNARAAEMTANWGALRVMAPNLVELFRKDKPDVANALDETFEAMLAEINKQ